MTTPVWFNVFENRRGEKFLGSQHPSRDDAIKLAGPLQQFYFGSRPVYRLRVTFKVPQR